MTKALGAVENIGQDARDRYRAWIVSIVVGNVIALSLLIWLTANVGSEAFANVIVVGLVGIASIDVVIISALTGRETLGIMEHQERKCASSERSWEINGRQ